MKHPVYQGRRLSSLTIFLLMFGCLGAAVCAPQLVKKGASACVYPFFYLQHRVVEYGNALSMQRATVHELESTVGQLRQENHQLMARIIEHESAAHYMQGIQELLAFKQRYALDGAHCVKIVSTTISEQSHSMVIDAGSAQGIEPDMIALYNNVLLGRVTHVYPHYSKVVLVSDRGCKVAAYCAATGAHGIHEGCNGVTSLLSKVSHLEKVDEQDLVISSGQGLIFPQGFALGRIVKVQQQDLFYAVTVAPLIELEKLSYCMIISKQMISLPRHKNGISSL
ncbi:MAG: rod shape-determining protein MreC [Epsilonproteobacteria bacterium]|nr:rod shape-determining protein MreC [Campylobacterota bacterium]